MKNSTKNNNLFLRFLSGLRATLYIFTKEFKGMFRDRGVMIIIIVAPLVYPLLYPYLYKNETVVDVPIAVVDQSNSSRSKEFIRHLDATMDVKVAAKFENLQQAQTELYKGNIHGIVFIPKEFNKKLIEGEQATIGMYSDMSSFLYYRAMMLSVNYVSLDMGEKIQAERLNDVGEVGEQAEITAKPIPHEGVILYNPGMGFGSFLLMAVLIIMIHQTLFFGIGMAAAAEREDNPNGELITSATSHGKLFRVLLGRALSYFIVYLFWAVFMLMVVPRIFNLPHIGDWQSMLSFVVPFLLATIFFSMTFSVFNKNRETQMILLVFFSLILLFLSGISWPQYNMSGFWRTFSYLFPSTFGIQAFIKTNTMGGTSSVIRFETAGMWIQTIVYFIITSFLYYREIKKQRGTKAEISAM